MPDLPNPVRDDATGRRPRRSAHFVPRPVLTLAVGITGHRAKRLGTGRLAEIRRHLAGVFASIDSACAVEAVRHADRYAPQTPRVRLFSSLSDGTDQLGWELAPAGWERVGLLPLPKEDSLAALLADVNEADGAAIASGFHEACAASASVVSLPNEEGGLARAAGLLVRQIDILIAVWDGVASDHPGGTADVVARALEARIPVVWISSATETTPRLVAHMADLSRQGAHADARDAEIAEAIGAAMAVPEPPAGPEDAEDDRPDGGAERLSRFLSERPRTRSYSSAYHTLSVAPALWRIRAVLRLGTPASARAEWRDFLDAVPDRAFAARLETLLIARYAPADALATLYAHAYRSAYVAAYLLSVLAAAIAVWSLLPHHLSSIPEQIDHKAKLVVVELLIVTAILVIVFVGDRQGWHHRWLDYRALAEMLRHMRFLGTMGQYEPRAFAEAAAPPGRGWVLWYVRATMRELGLPSGPFDPSAQRRVLKAVESCEVDPQIAYHDGNFRGLSSLDRRLHHTGIAIFAATLLVLVGFLVLWFADFMTRSGMDGPETRLESAIVWIMPKVAFLAAVFPAIGAALSGIRFTGEFEGFAIRSAETREALQSVKREFAAALDDLTFDRTATVLIETAHILAADITGWRALYGRKRLTLPS